MKSERTEYLILGNSTAAIGAVEGIREIDRRTPIVLVSKEPYHTYSRPLISCLLAGEVNEAHMFFRPENFYHKNSVEARLDVKAVQVDPETRVMRTDQDGEIGFEKVLIATGGSPVVPPIDGANAKGVFTFASWDDAKAIGDYIEQRTKASARLRAVVIGAGLIGIKAAEALHARGLKVLMVELEQRILPLSLDNHASELVEQALREAGVDVRCGTTVARIIADKGSHVSGVSLKPGGDVPCGLVIMAAGVTPNTDLVNGTSVGVDRGILIDEHCQTTINGIYAAGDVVQVVDTLSGVSRPMPIFRNACRQGRVAGINMAGGDACLGGSFPMNSVEVFGLPTISVGLSTASGDGFEVLEKSDDPPQSYRRIVLRDNRVAGALFVGNIDRAGIVTGLMREKVDVSGIKELLLTNEFGMLSLPVEYRKHVVKGEGIEV